MALGALSFVSLFLGVLISAVWFGLQLGLGGILYASDTCDVPLDEWNFIGGIVGLSVCAAVLVTGSMAICGVAKPLMSIIVAFFAVYLFGWMIYGMVLLFQDDGLRCKLDDHGHDYSLWVYSLCHVLLTMCGGSSGIAGATSALRKS